jgi:hypothetical protein
MPMDDSALKEEIIAILTGEGGYRKTKDMEALIEAISEAIVAHIIKNAEIKGAVTSGLGIGGTVEGKIQ